MSKKDKLKNTYTQSNSSPVDDLVEKLENKVLTFLDQFYPIVDEKLFYLLPLPALYEFIDRLYQGHSDGMQLRRINILLANGIGGYLLYKYGGSIGRSIFNNYLLIGAAYYAFFKIVIGPGPLTKPTPDLDPCGNPIVRGGPDGRTGGGGAC